MPGAGVVHHIIRDGGWRFEIVDLDGRRIDRVLAQKV
jgi:CBS domain containing-hemolysin-like protein